MVAEGREDLRRGDVGSSFADLRKCLPSPPGRLGQGTHAAAGVGSARLRAVLVLFVAAVVVTPADYLRMSAA
jgi:hypothetical protein